MTCGSVKMKGVDVRLFSVSRNGIFAQRKNLPYHKMATAYAFGAVCSLPEFSDRGPQGTDALYKMILGGKRETARFLSCRINCSCLEKILDEED